MIKFYLEDMNHKCAIENPEFVSYKYAHGKLNRIECCYDYLNESKDNRFDKRRNINGEECIAVLPSGREVKALFFQWKVVYSRMKTSRSDGTYYKFWVQPRGLLVAKNDIKAIKYAQKCFNEKVGDL